LLLAPLEGWMGTIDLRVRAGTVIVGAEYSWTVLDSWKTKRGAGKRYWRLEREDGRHCTVDWAGLRKMFGGE